MPDAIRDALSPVLAMPVLGALVYLVVSFLAGLAVAVIYIRIRGRTAGVNGGFVTTLVLLTIFVALTALVIGDNVARAFSLVGALAIVRFRTVVEDTRDTVFVIFAVVIGMAVGSGHFIVACIGVPFVGAAAEILGRWGRGGAPSAAPAEGGEVRVTVRVTAGADPGALLGEVLGRCLESFRLVGAVTARQGVATDYRYAARLREPGGAAALVRDLQQIDGVQHVELEVA